MYNIFKIVHIGYVVAIKTYINTTSVKSLCFVSAFSCWAIILCLLHKIVLEVIHELCVATSFISCCNNNVFCVLGYCYAYLGK